MNIYYKFVLLLVLSFVFFSCEKQDNEVETSTYEGGMLAIIVNKDIAHFAEDGSISYNLYKKANEDSLSNVRALYEGKNSIYIICKKEIVVVDKLTFKKKNVIPSPNGKDIYTFTFIDKHETAVLSTLFGITYHINLINGQILKEIDWNTSYDWHALYKEEYFYNNSINELFVFNNGDNEKCYLDPLTLEVIVRQGVGCGYFSPTLFEGRGTPTHSRKYIADANQTLWRLGEHHTDNYDSPVEGRVYFEAIKRLEEGYLSARIRYLPSTDESKKYSTFNIDKTSNILYYVEHRGTLNKINIADINTYTYQVTLPPWNLSGNERALEELVTPLISFPHPTEIYGITINEKNGDVIVCTNDSYLRIYDKNGSLKKSYFLEFSITFDKQLSINHVLIRD